MERTRTSQQASCRRATGARARRAPLWCLMAPLSFLVLLLGFLGHTARAETPITVGTPTVVNRYPEEFRLSFPLKVHPPDLRVVRAVGRVRFGQQASVHRVEMAVTPGPSPVVAWTWDTRRITVPPYYPLQVQLRLQTEDGSQIETAWQTFVYEDNRFPWQEIAGRYVQVRWYKGEAEFGQLVLRSAERTVEKITEELAVPVERPLVVILYATEEDFFSWQALATEWIGGQAFPEAGVAVEILPPDSAPVWLYQVVPHEMAHLVLFPRLQSPLGRLPSWLIEGLAQHFEWTPEPLTEVNAQLREQGVLPLGIMRSTPGQRRQRAYFWYMQAYSMVEYLFERHGREAVIAYMDFIQKGVPPQRAFERAFGETEEAFYTAWREAFGLPERFAATPSPSLSLSPPEPTRPISKGPNVTPLPTSDTINTTVQWERHLFIGGVVFVAVVVWLVRRR